MSATLKIRPATAEDTKGLLALINSTPQPGDITINFERMPDFFHGARIVTSTPDIWVMRDEVRDTLAAVFSIGSRPVYVNGERRDVRYGNDLRIHPDYRGGRSLVRLFKKYREIMEHEWMQTVILNDNTLSLDTVGSGRAGLPMYYPFGELHTQMVFLRQPITRRVRRPASGRVQIRRADATDIPVMQTFFDHEAPLRQFYPDYRFSDIERDQDYHRDLSIRDFFLAFEDGRLVGMVGVWDQKHFKQTRFVRYSGSIRWLRPINNLHTRLFGGVNLPPAGNTLNYLMLHCTLITDNRIDIFEALFDQVFMTCAQASSSTPGMAHCSPQALVCAFTAEDPLQQVLRKYRRQTLKSRHFIASYTEDPRPGLDTHRPLYLEAARI
ncbi:MAG: hypothetical protein LPK85_04190 [Gammaproteobacteria bacterium]|nr:hypothetical protein [Gammaproteobacteria bacterium]